LQDFVWQLRKERGYGKVVIPHITKQGLYEKSGHWAKYAEDLFKINTRDGHVFAMKPMNCPHHTQIYDSEPRSYRDLPQRYAESTMVYRDEQTGELSGLSRVISITQDDAHIFCRMNQIETEAKNIWDIIQIFYSKFGFKMTPRLSRRDPVTPEKYLGSPENWDFAEAQLKNVIAKLW
jgi:threonyl-tRNA synthetase